MRPASSHLTVSSTCVPTGTAVFTVRASVLSGIRPWRSRSTSGLDEALRRVPRRRERDVARDSAEGGFRRVDEWRLMEAVVVVYQLLKGRVLLPR